MSSSEKLLYLILVVCLLNLGLFAYMAGTVSGAPARESGMEASVNPLNPPSNVGGSFGGGADIFVQIADIPGGSTDHNHPGWIEANALTFGVTQSQASTRSSGGARSSERADIHEVIITKWLDKSSVKLFEASTKGSHVEKVVIELARPTTDKAVYFRMELKDVFVTYVVMSATSSSGPRMLEEIRFNPGTIKIAYTETDHRTGAAMGDVEFGWDINLNAPI